MGILATTGRALIQWIASHAVPIGGWYDVYSNGGAGAVDYDTRLNAVAIEAWPDGGSGKIGWGRGPWGRGKWGRGGRWTYFRTPKQTDGTYTFAVVGRDLAGNGVTPATEEISVTIAATPRAIPAAAEATAWNAGTDTLSVGWALSPDDEEA